MINDTQCFNNHQCEANFTNLKPFGCRSDGAGTLPILPLQALIERGTAYLSG
jgi:hypothetical protein